MTAGARSAALMTRSDGSGWQHRIRRERSRCARFSIPTLSVSLPHQPIIGRASPRPRDSSKGLDTCRDPKRNGSVDSSYLNSMVNLQGHRVEYNGLKRCMMLAPPNSQPWKMAQGISSRGVSRIARL